MLCYVMKEMRVKVASLCDFRLNVGISILIPLLCTVFESHACYGEILSLERKDLLKGRTSFVRSVRRKKKKKKRFESD